MKDQGIYSILDLWNINMQDMEDQGKNRSFELWRIMEYQGKNRISNLWNIKVKTRV